MGRLENFIPRIGKTRYEKHGQQYLVSGEGLQSIAIDGDIFPFFDQLNGHLSLREIFMFLSHRNEPIRFEKTMRALHEMAKVGFLANGEDFLKIYDPDKGEPLQRVKHPHLNNLSPSYFSQERLVALLQKTTLFLKCERKVALNIIKHSVLENVQENLPIIKQGTKSKEFFVLLAGEVGVFRNKNCLAKLTPLSVFGESAAIFDKERNADVYATSPCWLLRINATHLVDTKSPTSFDSFEGLKSRLLLNQTLAANPLFSRVPSDVMQLFISKCRIEKHAKERVILEQGSNGADFYFILKGSVSVIKDNIPVTSLTEGDHFGEVGAFYGMQRTASVITETNSVFLVLQHDALFEILCSHFRLAMNVEKVAELRLNSKENVFSRLDDTSTVSHVDPDAFTSSVIVDEEFIEITGTNFDIEVFDFSNMELDLDDEAS